MEGVDTITVHASDVSRQKFADADVMRDATVNELLPELVNEMELPANDVSGRPLTYHARLEREGRHLLGPETVGEALEENDRLVIQPNIDAG